MPKPTKAVIKALTQVRRNLAILVQSLGGTILEETEDRTECLVTTAAGPLALTIYNGWLAGRFSDDRAALLGLGDTLNRYSLKYNVQGTEQSAIEDPEGYQRLAQRHIERAVKAMLRDETITVFVGPKDTKTALSVVYTGSAVEWLAREGEDWQDKNAVKTLVTSSLPYISQLSDRHWFAVQRS